MGQCTSSQAQSAEAVAERAAERQAAVEQQQRRRERQARAEASAARRLRETIIIEPGAAGRVGRGGSELDQPDDEGCTQLHRAAASGDAAAVRLLLDARASLHAVNGRGR